MSSEANDESHAGTVPVTGMVLILGICCLLVVGGGAIGLSFGGVAVAEETNNTSNHSENISSPVLADAERVSETVINITIETEAELDAETVTESEFFLSAGSVESVAVVHTSDERAIIELELVEPVAEDEVVIGVARSTQIADSIGNTLNTSERRSVSVTGMDAVPPALVSVNIPSISTNETTLGYQFDQSVASLSVSIDGPLEKELTLDEFEERPNIRYTSDVELEEGDYTVTIHEATDAAGNTAAFDVESPLEINTSVPTAIAEVNRTASEGTTVVFDGSRSETTAESFEWSFGDGETATGESVSHTFHPGVYEVTLETTDAAGNVGTDDILIDVSSDDNSPRVGPQHWPDEPEIAVQRLSRAYGVDTLVEFIGVSAGETVTAPEGDEPLTTTQETTVESVAVTPTTETSIGLGVTGIENDDAVATTFADEMEMSALGGFSASPTVAPSILDEVEVTLTVTQDAIADADASVDDVALYHDDGGWDEREITVQDEHEGVYELTATTDGFSSFILAVPDVEDDETEDDESDDDESEDSTDEAEQNESSESEAEDETDETDDGEETETNESDEDETANESENGDTDENETDEPTEEPPSPEEPPEEEENGAFLGIIPHWLVTTVFVFIALPLFTAYTGLKALAFYLGY